MDQILPNLWLGTEQAARDVPQLQRHAITLVISIVNTRTRHKTAQAYAAANIALHHFEAVDCDVQDLSVIAPAVHLLITAQRDSSRATLVHCHLGKSRSAACVVYHLMQRGLDDEPQGRCGAGVCQVQATCHRHKCRLHTLVEDGTDVCILACSDCTGRACRATGTALAITLSSLHLVYTLARAVEADAVLGSRLSGL